MPRSNTAPLEVTDVRERIIDLLAVPYDDWTPVDHHGQMIEESFAPGAFGSIRTRLKRSRWEVNLDHDRTRYVGRVLDLDPDDPAGLRSELLIRRGPEGDQVLDDAADGHLCGSVGFACHPEDQQWETKSRRRIVKAFLDHIALTFNPAYRGAQVLAVRHDIPAPPRTPTPNLDRIMAERLAADYSRSLT